MKHLNKIIFFLLFFSSSYFYSQLRIEITGGTDEPIKVAMVPFEWTLDLAPPFYLHEIVKKDLESFAEFSVLNPEDMLSYPTLEEEVSYRDWRLLKVDYLIIGSVLKSEIEGEVNISYSILDVSRQKNVHKALMMGSLRSLNRIGHNISDRIYEKINGIPGIFSTRIAYVDKPVANKESYDLRITDINGEGDLSLFLSSQPILSPDWSPDGKQIAYVSFEEGTSRIYIQELSTGNRRALKHEKGINSSPSWSPDGNFLTAVLSKGGNPDLYLYDLKKNNWKQLTNHYGIDTEPDWSPNGKSLIFTSNRSGSPQIYEINISSMRVKRKTFEGTYNARARYLPDGKKIIYVHRRKGVFHIALHNLKTGKISILTDTFLDESPSVAPNGNVIIYATKDKTTDTDVLAGVTINGKTKFILPSASGGAREPAWSPILDEY